MPHELELGKDPIKAIDKNWLNLITDDKVRNKYESKMSLAIPPATPLVAAFPPPDIFRIEESPLDPMLI